VIDFLEQFQVSQSAIKIYDECLGNYPLTYLELASLAPHLDKAEFIQVLKELIDNYLLVELVPRKPRILTYYFALPPIVGILKQCSDMGMRISSIKELVIGSLKQNFADNNKVSLDNINNRLQELKEEYKNDLVRNNQNIDKNLEEMEKVKETMFSIIKNLLTEHQQKIRAITQAQFGNLIKVLKSVKTQLTIKIKSSESKAISDEILGMVEAVFSAEFKKGVSDFTATIFTLIDLEFKSLMDQLNKGFESFGDREQKEQVIAITDNIGNFRKESELIFTKLVNNLESNTTEIQNLIFEEREGLANSITENFEVIFQDSIKEFSELSALIEGQIQQFTDKNPYTEKMSIDNVWIINSIPKINEEIIALITQSKKEITIIVPKIENFLKREDFQNLPSDIKIKLASSNAHDDDIVKEYLEMQNLEYRTIRNENTIALKGDQEHVVFGVIDKNSPNTLNNTIGIGSNFEDIIEIFNPLIETTWSFAKPLEPESVIQPEPVSEPVQNIKAAEIVTQDGEILKSNLLPKPADKLGIKINDAFNSLIGKLGKLQGYEFGRELQEVSDLVFENLGFCSTLHKISSIINVYKPKYKDLDENDKKQIFNSIETWKEEIFAKTGMHL